MMPGTPLKEVSVVPFKSPPLLHIFVEPYNLLAHSSALEEVSKEKFRLKMRPVAAL